MKTSRLLLLAGLILGTASLLTAGPGPQFWVRPAAPKPAAAKVAPARTTPANPAVAAVCANCPCARKS